MRRFDGYQTSDGALFDSLSKATRHAEERYGAALTKLAREAVQIDKYLAMGDFIEANLTRFVDLAALARDRVIAPTDDIE